MGAPEQEKSPQQNNQPVVDLRQGQGVGSNTPQGPAGQGQQVPQEPSPQNQQFNQQVPGYGPSYGPYGPPYTPYPPQAQAQSGQPPRRGTKFLLGCCIFLLVLLIALVGTGVFFIKQGVDILRKRGVSDFAQFFEEKCGSVLRESIENTIDKQIKNFNTNTNIPTPDTSK